MLLVEKPAVLKCMPDSQHFATTGLRKLPLDNPFFPHHATDASRDRGTICRGFASIAALCGTGMGPAMCLLCAPSNSWALRMGTVEFLAVYSCAKNV